VCACVGVCVCVCVCVQVCVCVDIGVVVCVHLFCMNCANNCYESTHGTCTCV